MVYKYMGTGHDNNVIANGVKLPDLFLGGYPMPDYIFLVLSFAALIVGIVQVSKTYDAAVNSFKIMWDGSKKGAIRIAAGVFGLVCVAVWFLLLYLCVYITKHVFFAVC